VQTEAPEALVSADRVSVDEAQRNLPDIIEALRKDGGRVEIMLDGEPVVCLVPAKDAPAAQIVEEPPPQKRTRRRSAPKQPRLQHAHKREPRADD
jgi:antitoxin (DNA-binding transcriptional repressor) of toxin-antitoxin stability system